MDLYAEEAGLGRRLIIPLPFLTPRPRALWILLVTPVPAALARPLAEGLRGFLDRVVGGVGLAWGRRSGAELYPGDALDFWRVVAVERPHRLLLVAVLELAVLELAVEERPEGESELRQTAPFLPPGLAGLFYWWSVTPIHNLIFNGMLTGVAKAAGATALGRPERLPKPK